MKKKIIAAALAAAVLLAAGGLLFGLHRIGETTISAGPEPIRTGQLAQALGVSREYLSRTFKAVEGISLCAYIRDNRIKTAKKLLRHSERSILDISRYLGFSSQSHFTESFKAETGTTPQEYRRIFRET